MPGTIPPSFIRDIVELTDIVELIEAYVPLKKRGKDHWGLCPFCDDGANPSFSISSQKQFFYCFKCRATGNVIGFLEAFEGLGFVESVETLAAKAGIEIPYEQSLKGSEEKENIFEVLDCASAYYSNILTNDSSSERVQKYLKEQRKISGETSRKYSVGYAPRSWSSLTNYLGKEGFSDSILIKAGLAKFNKEKELYDVFRDRLMFPIRDRKGRTAGFGGRVLNSNDQPKYLNTGETPVFQKGRELYGLYESLKERRSLSSFFVVEGYLDVLALSENGVNNAVATLGIATNRFHTQKLLQLVNEVIFCFDGDDAGRGAAWGALKNVLPVIIDTSEIKFLFLPEGQDPASLLEKEDKDRFVTRLDKALPLSSYFMERLSKAIGTSSLEKKALLAYKALDLLKSMQDSSIKKLLEREVSRVTGLSLIDIEKKSKAEAVKKKRPKKNLLENLQQTKEEKTFESDGVVSKALVALVTYPKLIDEIKTTSWIEELTSPESNLFLQVINYFKNNHEGQVSDLLSTLDAESSSFIGGLLSTNPLLEEKNSVPYFQDCLVNMRKNNPKLRIRELKEISKERNLTNEETFELQQHLLAKLQDLDEESKQLLKELSHS